MLQFVAGSVWPGCPFRQAAVGEPRPPLNPGSSVVLTAPLTPSARPATVSATTAATVVKPANRARLLLFLIVVSPSLAAPTTPGEAHAQRQPQKKKESNLKAWDCPCVRTWACSPTRR